MLLPPFPRPQRRSPSAAEAARSPFAHCLHLRQSARGPSAPPSRWPAPPHESLHPWVSASLRHALDEWLTNRFAGHLDSNKPSAACQVLSNLLKILVNWPLNFHPERSVGSASRLRQSPGLPHDSWLPGNSLRFRSGVRLTILAMVTSLIRTSGACGKDFTSTRNRLYARTTPCRPGHTTHLFRYWQRQGSKKHRYCGTSCTRS